MPDVNKQVADIPDEQLICAEVMFDAIYMKKRVKK